MPDLFINPDERFLLVTGDRIVQAPPNVDVQPPTRDIRSIYARTKLLLMPSVCESYGRVAIEAAMSDIPTIAADLLGIREATAGKSMSATPLPAWVLEPNAACG